MFSDMTGREVLDLLAGLKRKPADLRFQRELQERLEMPETDLRRKLREYSTGMKRKLGLIQAFQSDPLLLILDEPTEGLDPLMQEAFNALVVEAKRRGATIFMSSHVLSDVDRVCDRVALLRQGELVLLSTVEDIRKVASRQVRVYFTEDVPLPPALPPGATMTANGPRLWTLKVEGFLGPMMEVLRALPVKDVEIVHATLEDVVMQYYRGGRE
jgi:ABC-2 type transport system ATP-binding protein